jgi:hypothetical protein
MLLVLMCSQVHGCFPARNRSEDNPGRMHPDEAEGYLFAGQIFDEMTGKRQSVFDSFAKGRCMDFNNC